MSVAYQRYIDNPMNIKFNDNLKVVDLGLEKNELICQCSKKTPVKKTGSSPYLKCRTLVHEGRKRKDVYQEVSVSL
ncbi:MULTISPECIES: hypothetical protein [unclassified Colwellia]|uniref:hypothetical protein n=1 Tax=unclassified Colwellia TaxID=196834 RepID=UPI0015F591D0|nr:MULTISPECIES: hypothetical protein [unclassified Colwellia]MBA6305439.1 hypothetical protein [Colwellia sp. MB02u-14]MBA6231596.1 hypothetical protein [Colwellia sp. MB02u-7]MBA6235460.1 hypothetical protein [Colwellia sp. MB02u-11]MBA6299840.1 hypothetical protein [Colwellia sp. MB3u-22]MBA6310798.1 hypothetical protein [Colwellia sp. MB3u-64]